MIKIDHVDNGYIIRNYCEGKLEETVVVDEEMGEPEAARSVLWHINTMLGNTGGRYDEKRIYIELRPGDKHPDADKEEDETQGGGCGAC